MRRIVIFGAFVGGAAVGAGAMAAFVVWRAACGFLGIPERRESAADLATRLKRREGVS